MSSDDLTKAFEEESKNREEEKTEFYKEAIWKVFEDFYIKLKSSKDGLLSNADELHAAVRLSQAYAMMRVKDELDYISQIMPQE